MTGARAYRRWRALAASAPAIALERDAALKGDAASVGTSTVLTGFASDVRARRGDGRESELFHLRYDLFDALG